MWHVSCEEKKERNRREIEATVVSFPKLWHVKPHIQEALCLTWAGAGISGTLNFSSEESGLRALGGRIPQHRTLCQADMCFEGGGEASSFLDSKLRGSLLQVDLPCKNMWREVLQREGERCRSTERGQVLEKEEINEGKMRSFILRILNWSN